MVGDRDARKDFQTEWAHLYWLAVLFALELVPAIVSPSIDSVNATIHGRTTDELRTADELFMVQRIQDPKALTLSRHSRPAIIQ